MSNDPLEQDQTPAVPVLAPEAIDTSMLTEAIDRHDDPEETDQ